jgi:hypothetical protein
MAGKTTIQLIGDKKLLNMLDALPLKAKDKKFWRTSARAAANPIVKSVRKKVPIDRGDLKRSIKYKNFSDQAFGGRGGYVKADHWSKSNTMTNPAKASILVHNRKTKPLKKTIPNFFKEAARETGTQSAEVMAKRAAKFMEREINKLL